jgi:hypothetical protein
MRKLIAIAAVLLPVWGYTQTTYQIDATDDPSPVIRQDVNKISDPARTKDTVLPVPHFTYSIQSRRYNTTFGLDTIKAAKMGSEPLPKLYRTYSKIGIGNYASVMGEFSIMSTRSKTNAWGLHLGHWSAGSGPKDVAGEYSGFSSQNVHLFGKRFTKTHELSGGFGFNRDVVYNYGSPAASNVFTKEYTRQKYNFYNLELGVKSFYSDSEAVNHNVRAGYQHFDNRMGVTEDRILFNANAGRFIRTEYLDATFGIDYNRVSGLSDTANSTIISFIPRFSKNTKKFQLSAATAIYHETDGEGGTYFYPRFYVAYDIVNHIIVPYLSLNGTLDRNNYRSLAHVNPFVSSAIAGQLKNTQRIFELEIGLKGSLSAQVFYQVSASRYELKNAPFYVNTTFSEDVMQNKFMVVYDGADVVHVGGQLGWQQRERIRVVAGGDWYQYKMSNELRPWHTPTLRLNLLATYSLQDKILVHSEIYYLNGQYARTGTVGNYGEKLLKGLVDVNLGFEYKYNKFFSLYLDFRNLGAQRYERWNAYPTQKFNFMGGLTYTF